MKTYLVELNYKDRHENHSIEQTNIYSAVIDVLMKKELVPDGEDSLTVHASRCPVLEGASND